MVNMCRYRARVARGEETRGSPGPQPSGSNIREMVSAGLARIDDIILDYTGVGYRAS